MSKRIVIDLDVLTVALWEKSDPRKKEAKQFLEKVREGEFELYSPLLLFQQLSEWRNKKLVSEIIEFLIKNSSKFLDVRELEVLVEKKTGRFVSELIKSGKEELQIKKSDLSLVLYASGARADLLVTFDKGHLLNNQDDINKFLKKKGLPTIKIIEPGKLT